MSALRDILAPMDEPSPPPPPPQPAPAETMPPPSSLPTHEPAAPDTPKADEQEEHTSTTTSTRRNPSGSLTSVYSGNKIKHLKKEDGIPLWRKDIQYDFLKLVFYDETRCFSKYDADTPAEQRGGFTFAEVYIDAMAKSSKCSKILKEKLLQDTEGAISMAMVCLLVNVGRMNTTLNFFPEMRAQLRTYHSIPALQAHQDPNAYKQLQDAPRLKSILKGATEDEPQPSTMEEVRAAKIPRTNPVNLIFIMSQYAPKISETHFSPPRDFFDLVMRSSLSSASRARAFLWLIWWYLESDFSYEDSQRCPFGPGQYGEGEDAANALPLKVPTLESLTEEQALLENVDTESEEQFGEVKRKERIAILASEPSPAMTALKRARKEKGLTSARERGKGGAAAVDLSDEEGSEAGSASWFKGSAVAGRASGLHPETDSQYTRSPSPPMAAAARVGGFQAVNAPPKAIQPVPPPAAGGSMAMSNLLNDEMPVQVQEASPSASAAGQSAKKGPGRGNWRRKRNHQETVPLAVKGMESAYQPLAPQPGGGVPISFINEVPQGAPILPSTPGAFGMSNGMSHISPQQAGSSVLNFQPPMFRDGAPGHVPTPSYQAQKRNRGVTQHQSAVMTHRKAQIDYALDRRIKVIHQRAKRLREAEGSILRAWKRIRLLDPGYDSEEEGIKIRKLRSHAEKDGGEDWRLHGHGAGAKGKDKAPLEKENLADSSAEDLEAFRRPRVLIAGMSSSMQGEVLDVGEEARAVAKTMRRASRRLERWEELLPGDTMIRRRQLVLQAIYPATARHHPYSHQREADYERQRYEMDLNIAARRSVHRQRSGTGGRQSSRAGMGIQEEHLRASFEPGEEEGGGELDEEERELLGEVDADETDEEGDGDEDEEMGED